MIARPARRSSEVEARDRSVKLIQYFLDSCGPRAWTERGELDSDGFKALFDPDRDPEEQVRQFRVIRLARDQVVVARCTARLESSS